MKPVRPQTSRGAVTIARSAPGARSLGLGGSALEIVRMVQAGLPFERLLNLEKCSGLPRDVLSRLLAIAPRTLTRRQSEGRLRPDESDRVLRASRIFDLAVDLFEGDAAAARRWLQAPQPGLGGTVPVEIASTDVGAREVEYLIGRIEHGITT